MLLKIALLISLIALSVSGQDEIDDRGLHKRRRPRPYQSPCGSFRDLPSAPESERSLVAAAALGGAAAGYYLGTKQQKYQQPIINNVINTGGAGGFPCGGGGVQGGGGLLGSHLGSHLGGGGILSGLSGPRYPVGGINWDRTIRQFNRQVVRPLTHGWFK